MFRFCFYLFCLFAMPLAGPARALDAPQGAPILIVDGLIAETNDRDRALFDRAMLEALDWQEIETYTEFSPGVQRLAGPSLASLLDQLGVRQGTLRAVALDDYMIRIPVSDVAEFGIILAIERDGMPMRIRNRGPIWIVYPAPTREDVNELHSSRMIWQLHRLTVEP
ncbi:oxidoreductase [Mameliella sp. CS4]|uniref:oxidoreductase n=1 Tax=Mameliella sp. CS4 TaxID=2862329 RepID=UPI001C5DD160|nr:oxidoreductase [Mameliella sp. CS4]MBW4985808.1 oxidoreductase [Mameliella sp. CS4]